MIVYTLFYFIKNNYMLNFVDTVVSNMIIVLVNKYISLEN